MKLLILVFSLSLVMASIPDSVIRCGKEVSLSARALYTVYCSHHTGAGLAQVSDECAMDEAGISRSKFYEAVKELKGKGWIGKEKEGGIKLLKGREEFENAPSRFWTNRGIGPNSGLAPVENSPDFGQFSTGCMNKNA